MPFSTHVRSYKIAAEKVTPDKEAYYLTLLVHSLLTQRHSLDEKSSKIEIRSAIENLFIEPLQENTMLANFDDETDSDTDTKIDDVYAHDTSFSIYIKKNQNYFIKLPNTKKATAIQFTRDFLLCNTVPFGIEKNPNSNNSITRLSFYRLDNKPLGQGTFADVYSAKHFTVSFSMDKESLPKKHEQPTQPTLVAIKIMRTNDEKSIPLAEKSFSIECDLLRYRGELYAATRMANLRVDGTIDVSSTSPKMIMMKYHQGLTLFEILQKKSSLYDEKVATIDQELLDLILARDLIQQMYFLHNIDCVNLDVSFDNILVGRHANTIDFGCTHYIYDEKSGADEKPSKFDQFVGNFHTAAPEMLALAKPTKDFIDYIFLMTSENNHRLQASMTPAALIPHFINQYKHHVAEYCERCEGETFAEWQKKEYKGLYDVLLPILPLHMQAICCEVFPERFEQACTDATSVLQIIATQYANAETVTLSPTLEIYQLGVVLKYATDLYFKRPKENKVRQLIEKMSEPAPQHRLQTIKNADVTDIVKEMSKQIKALRKKARSRTETSPAESTVATASNSPPTKSPLGSSPGK